MAIDPAPVDGTRPPRRGSGAAEILVAGLVAAFLFGSFLVLPVVGAVALPFAAVPGVRLAHRRGAGAGLASSLVAAGLLAGLGLAAGSAAEAAAGALFAGAATGLPALAAAAVRRGVGPSRAYLALCLAGFAFLAGGLLAKAAAGGGPMQTEIRAAFEQMAQAVQAEPKGATDAETAARLKATMGAAREFAVRYWIGLVGASWVLAAAIAYYAGARYGRPAPSAEATRFERLSVPAPIVAIFVASGAAAVLAPSPFREAGRNLLLPLSALYFVAGLSIICHFARKWLRARLLRAGLYVLAVYFPLSVGVGLLGLFDWYADFRRRGEGAIEKT